MIPDLEWMIGSSLTDVEKTDYTWVFRFSDGTTITTTDSPWRLVGPEGILATSEDDGHQFGLPVPIDARQILRREAGGKAIENATVKETTGDLVLTMGQGSLEFLCLSMGYEAWHLTGANLEFVCMGGGRVERIEENEKGQRTRR
jgi:hypothetical protein